MNFDFKDEKYMTMSEIMTPDKANFTGNVHGGHLLRFLDQVAYATAARYSGKYMVTLSVDQVLFKKPIYVGDLVTCFASINYVGSTSLEVGIEVYAENLRTKEKRHTDTCFFTMVALDDQGKPTTIPPLSLNSDEERKRFKEGKLRKEMRRKNSSEISDI